MMGLINLVDNVVRSDVVCLLRGEGKKALQKLKLMLKIDKLNII